MSKHKLPDYWYLIANLPYKFPIVPFFVFQRVNSLYHERLLMILQGNMATLQSGYGRNVYSLIVNGVPLD